MPAKPCQVKNVMFTGYNIVTSRLIKRKSQIVNNTTDKSLKRATRSQFPLTCVTGAIHHRISAAAPEGGKSGHVHDVCDGNAQGETDVTPLSIRGVSRGGLSPGICS